MAAVFGLVLLAPSGALAQEGESGIIFDVCGPSLIEQYENGESGSTDPEDCFADKAPVGPEVTLDSFSGTTSGATASDATASDTSAHDVGSVGAAPYEEAAAVTGAEIPGTASDEASGGTGEVAAESVAAAKGEGSHAYAPGASPDGAGAVDVTHATETGSVASASGLSVLPDTGGYWMPSSPVLLAGAALLASGLIQRVIRS